MTDDAFAHRSLSRPERIEALKNMLVAVATGSTGNDVLYAEARRELLADGALAERMPPFLKTCRTIAEFWQLTKAKFRSYAERRDWLRDEFDPLLTYLEDGARNPMTRTTDLALRAMTDDGVHDVWRRMLDRRDADPEGAITAARTLLETVCKHILADLGEHADENAELPALHRVVSTKLNLAPDQHTEQVFKQILGGCATVVGGLAAVRNKLSDAHGKGPRAARPSARHAELAVNLAGSMAAFLVATWAARKSP